MKLQLPWTNLKGVKTDEAPSMIGKEAGLIGRIRQEMNNPEFYMELHCIIHSLFVENL
jgi:hypothetical protein